MGLPQKCHVLSKIWENLEMGFGFEKPSIRIRVLKSFFFRGLFSEKIAKRHYYINEEAFADA